MTTRATPAHTRQSAAVRQWRAAQARQAARRKGDRVAGGRRPYRWHAASREIMTVTLEAGRAWPADGPAVLEKVVV